MLYIAVIVPIDSICLYPFYEDEQKHENTNFNHIKSKTFDSETICVKICT